MIWKNLLINKNNLQRKIFFVFLYHLCFLKIRKNLNINDSKIYLTILLFLFNQLFHIDMLVDFLKVNLKYYALYYVLENPNIIIINLSWYYLLQNFLLFVYFIFNLLFLKILKFLIFLLNTIIFLHHLLKVIIHVDFKIIYFIYFQNFPEKYLCIFTNNHLKLVHTY